VDGTLAIRKQLHLLYVDYQWFDAKTIRGGSNYTDALQVYPLVYTGINFPFADGL